MHDHDAGSREIAMLPHRLVRLLAALVLAIGLAAVPAPPAVAAVGGDLDLSFSGDGRYVEPGNGIRASAVAVQDDGKIVVAGYSGYWGVLQRYLPGGTLDTTFGDGGEVLADFGASTDINDLAIQDNGRIVIVGTTSVYQSNDYSDIAIARYTTSGALDTSFRGDGISTIDLGFRERANAVAIAPDGRIVIAGRSQVDIDFDFQVARFTTGGALDSTFSGDGRRTTGFGGDLDEAEDVAVQTDGKIVAIGRTDADGVTDYDFAIARYTAGGSPDVRFNYDGKVSTGFGRSDRAQAVALQTDGKIVVAGHSSDSESADFAVGRYTTSGFLDTSFSGDGQLTTGFGGFDYASALAIQKDGRIVVAGSRRPSPGGVGDFALARYNLGGSLNTSFGGDGRVVTDLGGSEGVSGLALQPDRKIVAVGIHSTEPDSPHAAIARYHWTTDPPPDTAIDSGPSGSTADTTPTFTFHATEAGATFECSIGTAYSRCTSPRTYGPLEQGSYTFRVRAVDTSAQKDTTPAARTFLVDRLPNTTITGGPSGPTRDSTPTFTFTATEDATFTCAVDGAAYVACSSPITLPVQVDGTHTVRVLATDKDGTPDTETNPASRSFTVDTVPPDTFIDTGPPPTTTDTTPTFEFHATEPGAMRCRVNSGVTYSCTSPWTTPSLPAGAHVVSIWALDAAGNPDPTPATWPFEVVAASG